MISFILIFGADNNDATATDAIIQISVAAIGVIGVSVAAFFSYKASKHSKETNKTLAPPETPVGEPVGLRLFDIVLGTKAKVDSFAEESNADRSAIHQQLSELDASNTAQHVEIVGHVSDLAEESRADRRQLHLTDEELRKLIERHMTDLADRNATRIDANTDRIDTEVIRNDAVEDRIKALEDQDPTKDIT